MDVLKKIKTNHEDAVVPSCAEERQKKLKVKMTGLKDYVILKGELLSQGEFKVCDCLIVIQEGKSIKVALVERKTSRPRIGSDEEAKYRNAYRLIEEALPGYGINNLQDIAIKFVLYYEKNLKPTGLRTFENKRIEGKKIVRKKYNELLKTVFD
ncbi:MAG: hypothetical protein R6V10_14645 [bacterium]